MEFVFEVLLLLVIQWRIGLGAGMLRQIGHERAKSERPRSGPR